MIEEDLRGATSVPTATAHGLCRGLVLGSLAVAAVGCWAINLARLFDAAATPSLFEVLAALFLCEAVPLAVLSVLVQRAGSHERIEETLRGIVDSIFWFVPKGNAASEA